MQRTIFYSLLCLLLVAFAISCSSGDGGIIAPPTDEVNKAATVESGNTACFGLWQFSIDTTTGSVDITRLREADKIINVLGFMEPPPLSSMDLDWDDLDINPDAGTISVGVILKHPIPDPVFTGFDVRGVCFGPEVDNADGLTIVMSPEFFSGVPFGYQNGLLGAPDSVGDYSGLAGYKYYCNDIGEDESVVDFFSDPLNLEERGSFSPSKIIQRNFVLDWNNVDQDFFIFNYAIYANYDWPVGDPPIVLDDFEITSANSAEAFCINVTETANSLYYFEGEGGGSLSLSIDAWDWQGNISGVTIESVEAGVLDPTTVDTSSGPGSTANSYMFDFTNVSAEPTAAGDMELLITVTDAVTFGGHWFLNLLDPGNALYDEQIYTCWKYTTTVAEESPFTEMDPVMVDSLKEYYHANFVEDSNGHYHIFAAWEDPTDPSYYTWETRWFHSEDHGQTWTAEGDIFGSVSAGGNRKPPTLGFAAAADANGGVYVFMGETKQNATAQTSDVLQAKLKYLDTTTYNDPSAWSPADWQEKIAMNNIFGYRYAGGMYASLAVTPDGRILGTMQDYVQPTTISPGTSGQKYFYADSWSALPASAAGLDVTTHTPPGLTVQWYGGPRCTNHAVYNPVTDTFFVLMAGYYSTGGSYHGGAWVDEFDPNDSSGYPWNVSATWEDPTVAATTNRLFYNFYGDVTVDSSGNVYWVHQYNNRPGSTYSFNNCQFDVLYGVRDITSGTWDLTDNPINGDYVLPPSPPSSSTNQVDYERRALNLVNNANDELIMTWMQCGTHPNLLGALNSGSGWTAMPGNLVLDEADYPIYAYAAQGEALGPYVGITFVSEDDPPVDRRGQLWFFITDGV